MIVQCNLNGGVAEVDDDLGAELLAGGNWSVPGVFEAKTAPKTRTPRAKVAPAESAE